MMIARIAVLCAFVAIAFVATACQLRFEHPLPPPAGPTVDPSPYVGDWNLASVSDSHIDEWGLPITGTYSLEIIDDGSGAITAAYTGLPEETLTMSLQLSEITGTVMASAQDEEGEWDIGSLIIVGGGNSLEWRPLASQAFSEAVKSGELSGQVLAEDSEAESVRVTASSAEIRDFILQNPSVLTDEGTVVFTRTQSTALLDEKPSASEDMKVARANVSSGFQRTLPLALILLVLLTVGSVVRSRRNR